jgi:UDP-glucose 4-epimerase
MQTVLVTGGAGFIGSHLIDRLISNGYFVRCVDNFSSGKKEYVSHHKEANFELIEGDVLDEKTLQFSMDDCKMVFHLSANPDVRLGEQDTKVHFRENIQATYTVLETMKQCGIKNIVFTSTSTVYGDAKELPTPEDYGPLVPISLYGASKLACEALISSYCHTFGMKSVIYRFANVVGSRSTHGVTYDFVQKLKKNPQELEILGDGRQKKSYLYIADCIEAMMFGLSKSRKNVEIFNIGSEDWIDVREIADVVSQTMGINPSYHFTGGIDGGRGWKGDVKAMRLSIDLLKKMGWHPRYASRDAIKLTAREIL